MVTGLRPGEKMTEELTLSGSLIGTGHRKIFFTVEERLSEIEVAAVLRGLRSALATSDDAAAREIVTRWVDGYRRPTTDIEASSFSPPL